MKTIINLVDLSFRHWKEADAIILTPKTITELASLLFKLINPSNTKDVLLKPFRTT